jgi:hypothetical protein
MIEFIKIFYNNITFYIGLIYKAPNCTTNDCNILFSSIQKIINMNVSFMLIGDFNSRSVVWNDVVEFHSEEIKSLLTDNPDLCVVNAIFHKIPDYTHSTNNNHSILDLCLTNSINYVHDFFVDYTSALTSDHFPISVILNFSIHNVLPHPHSVNFFHWIIDALHFDAYKSYLDVYFNDNNFNIDKLKFFSHDPQINIDIMTSCITRYIIKAASNSFHTSSNFYHPHNTKVNLSDAFSVQLLQKYHKLHHYVRRHKDDKISRKLYEFIKQKVFKLIDTRKVEYFNNLLHKLEIEQKSKPWICWKKLCKNVNDINELKLNDNNNVLLNESQSVELISEHFAATSSNTFILQNNIKKSLQDDLKYNENVINNFVNNILNKQSIDTLQVPFSETDVKNLCKNACMNGLGFDNIHIDFIKNATDSLFHYLYILFSYCFKNNLFPSAWKNSKVIPLYKKNGSINDCNNFRPISVTSVLSRLFEKLILKQLLFHIESKLNPLQAGFVQNHSTLDNIFCLQEAIKFTNHNKSFLPVAFIDIEKAFDSINHNFLLYKLYKLHVPFHLIKLLQSFLSNRSLQVLFKASLSNKKMLLSGTPQGCDLSPTLFNIYINDLIDYMNNNSFSFSSSNMYECICNENFNIHNYKASSILYADDLAIIPNSIGLEGTNILKICLNRLFDWCTIWHLKISYKKSNVIIFSKYNHKHLPNSLKFFCNANEITITNHYKFLGVIFQSNTSFALHEQYVLKKFNYIKFHILKLFHSKIFMSPIVLLNLIKMVLLPTITYGIAIWNPCKTFFDSIDKNVCFLLKKFSHGPTQVSNDALFVEFRLLKLYYLKQFFIASYLQHLNQNNSSIIAKLFFSKSIMKSHISYKPLSDNSNTNLSKAHAVILHKRKIKQLNYLNVFEEKSTMFSSLSDDLIVKFSFQTYTKHQYKQTLFNHYVQQLRNNHEASTLLCLYDEKKSINLELPSYFYYHNYHSLIRLLRLRLDIVEINASIINRHSLHPSLDCVLCDEIEDREHLLLHCTSYQHEMQYLLYQLHSHQFYQSLSLHFLLTFFEDKAILHSLVYSSLFSYIDNVFNMRNLL